MKAFITQAKNRPCMDCRHRFEPHIMDFDHVRGRKLFTLGTLIALDKTLEQVKREIAKCDVVCSNCHRDRTHKRRTIKFKEAA